MNTHRRGEELSALIHRELSSLSDSIDALLITHGDEKKIRQMAIHDVAEYVRHYEIMVGSTYLSELADAIERQV